MNFPFYTTSHHNAGQFKKTSFQKKLIKYTAITVLSSYMAIKLLMLIRRQRPNIFIIKRNLGGIIGNYYKGGFDKKMARREACLILSVADNSNIKHLQEAYKRLMMLNHPDSGGSTYLASKINEAKDLLMQTAKESKH